jgi:ribosomal protein L20A (L18A)
MTGIRRKELKKVTKPINHTKRNGVRSCVFFVMSSNHRLIRTEVND